MVVPEAVPASAVDETDPPGGRPAPRRPSACSTSTAGAPLAVGEKSLAERLVFQAADRTLTDPEIDPALEAVVAALADELGARLRT